MEEGNGLVVIAELPLLCAINALLKHTVTWLLLKSAQALVGSDTEGEGGKACLTDSSWKRGWHWAEERAGRLEAGNQCSVLGPPWVNHSCLLNHSFKNCKI